MPSKSAVAAIAVLGVAALVGTALAASPGDPDPGFGFGSKVTTGFRAHGVDAAAAVVVDADKIVTAGVSGTGFAVTRHNADGTLDTSFGGGDGIVTTSFGPGLEAKATGVAVDPDDGGIAVAGTVRPPFNLGGEESGDFAVARYSEDGVLDTGFGGDGTVTTEFGENEDAGDVAIQSDGKIVVVGIAAGGFALGRYNTDGSLDSAFAGDGRQTTAISGADSARATGVAIQPGGEIVVGGTASDGDGDHFALARYESDGDPDSTFSGPDGQLTTDFGGNATAEDVVLQGTAIVLAGGADGDFALARYESDGDPDATFGGGDGEVTADLGNIDGAGGVAIGPGDTIVAAGGTAVGNPVTEAQLAVARFESDGDQDLTFGGGDGEVTTDFGPGTIEAGAGMAVQGDGKVVVAGAASPPHTSFEVDPNHLQDFILVRYLADGSALDGTFSGDGKIDQTIGSGFGERGRAVAVQGDGKLVVVGHSIDEPGPDDPDFAVARYLSNGAPDTGFSGDGKLTTDLEGADLFDSAHAVAVQGDGKILVAGSSDGDFALARYLANGSGLDTVGFGGGDGFVTTDFGTGFDEGRAIAIQTNGRIVVSGGSESQGLAVARYDSSGNPDGTFSGDGMASDGSFSPFAGGFGVAIQSNGAIVVTGAFDGGPSVLEEFALARFEDDGDPDLSFGGGDGVAVTNFTGAIDFASDVAIQSNGAIVAAGPSGGPDTPVADCGGESQMEMALARYGSNGNPDNSFSSDGKTTTDFAGMPDQAHGLVLQPGGGVVAAGRSNRDFAAARLLSTGTLDTSFSGDGRVTTDFGGSACDVAQDVALSGNGILLAGFTGDAQSSRFALTRYLRSVPAPSPQPSPSPAAAKCSDGADNDGDGLTDFPADPGCIAATDADEANADRTAPGGALSGKRRQKLARSVVVTFSCRSTTEDCLVSATGTLSVPGASKVFRLRRVRRRLVRRGTKAKLRLRLSRKARRAAKRALRRRRRVRVRVRVRVTVADAAGNKRTLRRTIRLRR